TPSTLESRSRAEGERVADRHDLVDPILLQQPANHVHRSGAWNVGQFISSSPHQEELGSTGAGLAVGWSPSPSLAERELGETRSQCAKGTYITPLALRNCARRMIAGSSALIPRGSHSTAIRFRGAQIVNRSGRPSSPRSISPSIIAVAFIK